MSTTTKKFAPLFAGLVALLASQAALAAQADIVQAALMDARSNLVAMIDATDKAVQEDHYAKLTQASKAVDDAVAAALADATGTPDDTDKYKAFQETWEAFKKTREGEIVPAVRAGKTADAKALATGIQAERMKKMKGLLGELGAK